ncbi:MAG: energy-coupled thiamine transporter ThiT [Clostridia bacterium]|nr:energy-coupled thiamine transporter ThiT [Clostridia bacterium]
MFSNLLDSAIWYPFLFDNAHNTVRSVAIWLTLILAIAFVVVFFALKAKNKPTAAFAKISLICTIIYAAALIITFLSFAFSEDGIVPILFIPLVILIAMIAVGGILIAVKRSTLNIIVAVSAIGAALLTTIICIAIHFASGNAAEANWLTNNDVNSVALYVFAAIAVVIVIAAAFFFGRNDKSGFDTKSITYAAICIAMSFALSYLRIVKMPQGGAITIASLLPLMIYAYAFGAKKGVLAGCVYGILQAVQDTYILHPAQFILDYPAAFSCIGLAGIFSSVKQLEKYPQLKFTLGAITAGIGRFIMHFISGIFAFGTFAPENQPVVLYSLSYQSVYIFPDLIICIAVGFMLFSSKSFTSQIDKFNK